MLDRKAIEIIINPSGATEEEIVYAKNTDYYNDAEAFPHNLAMQGITELCQIDRIRFCS